MKRSLGPWLVAAALLPLFCTPARAAWPGTPGRIAWLTGTTGKLQVVDPTPGGTGTPITIQDPTVPPNTNQGSFSGFGISAPAWSPDGTKLAYASAVIDHGLSIHGATVYHTAIWYWDVETGVTHQVTTPPDGYPDCGGATPCNLNDGYIYADQAPAWTADGTGIEFVRVFGVGKDSGAYSQRGGDVYTVGLDGSGLSKTVDEPTATYVTSMAAGGDQASGATALVGVVAQEGASDAKLMRLDTDETLLSSIKSVTLGDYDVAADGLHVDYLCGCGGAPAQKEIGINGGTDRDLGTFLGSALHSSPTGNGPIYNGFVIGPSGQPKGGIYERQPKDPARDQWDEDPLDRYLYPTAGFSVPQPGGARLAWDVQPMHLPVIGVPGFAGSKLYCGANAEWPISPNPVTNGTFMHDLALDANGDSPDCPGSAPWGDPLSDVGIVADVFDAKPIYQPMIDFVDHLGETGQGTMFSWDWRRSPGDNEARLQDAISKVLDRSFSRAQGVHQVVLYAHSYGGLLVRQYVQDHPNDVGRVLTVGTPYWGAAKAIFAIAFGIENPLSGIFDLDTFVPNEAMKAFMLHNAGVYHLLPSSHYGQWLTIGNAGADAAQTAAWLTGVGGADAGLISQAAAWHDSHDGFYTNGGKIDMRAVIGRGLLSITGVGVAPQPDAGGNVSTQIFLGDGDETVPAVSASQGTPGTHTPLGDAVHVQSVCKVPHMAEPGNSLITDAYAGYLLTGRIPLKTKPCSRGSGSAVEVKDLDVTPRPAARRAGTPMSLFDAWYADHIQLVDMPGDPTAITDDADPIDLSVGNPQKPVTITITHYVDGAPAATDAYPPLSGDVVVHSGPTGAGVTVDGQPVQPVTPTPTPSPSPTPTASATPEPTYTIPTPTPTATPSRPRLVLHVVAGRLRTVLKHGLRVRTTCAERCRVHLRLTVPGRVARRLHVPARLAAGSAAGRGRVTVVLRFGRQARHALGSVRKLKATVSGTAPGAVVVPRGVVLKH